MKKITNYILICTCALGFSSCVNTFLDLEPLDAKTDVIYFKTPEHFREYANGLYGQLLGWQSSYGSIFDHMDAASDLSTCFRYSYGVVTGILSVSLFMSGCGAAVEPEKRMYPMALGVDASEEGICLTYGMPDLSESTGQGKEEEDGGSRVLQISGADFTRIEKMYDQSQEKLLDMGHLQVLVMGRTLVEDGRWRMVLDYLKQEIFVGEDLYVFEAEDAGEILNWHGEDNSSAGEYITGLIRNRMSGGNITAVTLRELFYEKYKEDKILRLPIVKIRNGSLEVEV